MPANKPYHFHPQAWQEVEAAEAWYRQRDHEASARFLSEIYDALENLADGRSAGLVINTEHADSSCTDSRFPSFIGMNLPQ
jgi:plasmid stabilization system protein ParE